MSTIITTNYQEEILDTMRNLSRHNKWWSSPINLGGTSGASGGGGAPIGGTFGLLPQTKVAYDTTEAAYSGIQTNVPSGTLYDNLSHIRYRLDALEVGSGGGGGGATILNDLTDVTITSPADNEILAYDTSTGEWINQTASEASLSETGHTHTESDITDLDHRITVRKNTGADVGTRSRLNFIEGTDISLTVADDSGNDEVDITITSTASGGGGSSSLEIQEDDSITASGVTILNFEGTVSTLDEGAGKVTVTISGGGGGGGTSASGTRAILTADETIVNEGEVVSWDATDGTDDGGFWSSGNPTRLTAQTSGWHMVSAGFAFTTTDINDGWVTFRLNGSVLSKDSGVPRIDLGGMEFNPGLSHTRLVNLNVGDYVEVYCGHNSGSNRAINDGQSYFEMVGPI